MLIHVQHRFLTSRESWLFYRGTFINSATPLVVILPGAGARAGAARKFFSEPEPELVFFLGAGAGAAQS